MKFDKPKVHRQWTSEETQARITLVNSEISNFCRDLNLLDREMNTLRHRKESIQKKISNKVKYVNQLENQLDEIRINNAEIDLETFLIENLGPDMTRAHNDATEPDIADEQDEPDETMTTLFDFSEGSFLPGPYTHSLVWTPFTSSYEEFVISGSGLPNNIPVDELSFEEQEKRLEKMLIEHRDATEPDIADELRPWSASSSLSQYFRRVQSTFAKAISPNLVPTTPKYFEGNVNPTGSNSFGFNVQPLKLESSDITPEIDIRITTTTVDTSIKALKDLGV